MENIEQVINKFYNNKLLLPCTLSELLFLNRTVSPLTVNVAKTSTHQ